MAEKIMMVHSGKRRGEKKKLRDEIEVQKLYIENLERENEALVAALSSAGIEWKGVPDIDE